MSYLKEHFHKKVLIKNSAATILTDLKKCVICKIPYLLSNILLFEGNNNICVSKYI